MKTTDYTRKLLALCRAMRRSSWKLAEQGRIRTTNHPDHCPLSFVGGASGIEGYKEGGRLLGFTEDQIATIAYVSDNVGPFIFKDFGKRRRILLKAAAC